MIPVGIMQGRLLPPYQGRFQAFPATQWRQEIALAEKAGLQCVEWIYEVPNEADNPLRTDAAMDDLLAVARDHRIGIWSICADYYMERRLVARDGSRDLQVAEHLRWLIGRAGRLGARYMVLPFVDASALNGPAEYEGVIALLRDLAPVAADAGVELHLETALSPRLFVWLLDRIGAANVKANYDIGNSASLGFDQVEELRLLAPWLGSVHVKDRRLGGGTVPLGTGAAPLEECFKQIVAAGFDRWFILQVARGAEGDELEWIRQNAATTLDFAARAGDRRA